MAKNKQVLMLSVELTDQVNSKGEPIYQLLHEVDGEAGLAFFCMLTDFLHVCPQWVKEHIMMAVHFDNTHDRENCPHCRSQP